MPDMSRERHSDIPVVPAYGQGRRLEVNGTWIHVQERGSREAAAEVVVLLPGSGMSWRMWAPQIPALEGDYRLLLPDLRGTGDSERRFPHNVYDARRQAADVAAVLDAYGVAAAHVVGVSQGAVVAQLLAIDHPHRVRRLVVADSYSELPTAVSAVTLRVANTVAALLPMPVLKAAALAVYRHEPLVRTTLTASWGDQQARAAGAEDRTFPGTHRRAGTHHGPDPGACRRPGDCRGR